VFCKPRPEELPEALRPFVFRNATAIDSGVNFRNDIDRLIRSLDKILPANKTQGKWTAKLIVRRSNKYFLIELVRFDERHRLEFENENNLFHCDLKLDGVEIRRWYWSLRKKHDFQIGAHSARFQLLFGIRDTAPRIALFFPRIEFTELELRCDGLLILQAN
jgi:hypothetical protein